MTYRVFIILLSTLFAFCLPAHSAEKQDTLMTERYYLYYYRDRINIEPDYLNNSLQIMRIKDILTCSPHIDSIAIYAYSSPEGSPRHNEWLSQKRAEAAREFILANLPANSTLKAENIILHPMGENWEALYEELDANYHLPNRRQVMRVMRAKVPTETKKWRLQNLDNGFTYNWIIRHHMKSLRVATWMCVYISPLSIKADTLDVHADMQNVRLSGITPAPISEFIAPPYTNDFKWVIKTNLLYDALLVPNIGAEFHLGRNFTVGANLHFAWWNTDTWFWRTYGAELAVRKYFGSVANAKPMTGHHLGIYGQALTYDFLAFGKTGYMSGNPGENLFDRASWVVGIEYGYTLPITRRLNLDFVIGLGYQTGKYNEYEMQDECYVWKAFKNRRFFGPTKAEVTLVWLLGKDNYNRKGGRR